MAEPTLRILSLGAGVQSTTLALLACDGSLPGLDAAIFADTGWEPAQVYRQVDRVAAELERNRITFYRVSKGNLRRDAVNPDARFAGIPWFVRNPDGSQGIGRRQCTKEYKLEPIMRKCRELLGATPPNYRRVRRGQVVEQWIGFSTDEVGRVNDRHENLYTTKQYPLLDLGMSRKDCRRYLDSVGWGDTQKSACIGCPYHGNRAWRDLRARRDLCSCGHHRDEHWRMMKSQDSETGCAHLYNPDAGDDDAADVCTCTRFRSEWDDAVEFDRQIRKGGARKRAGQLDGEAFLHRSMLPLDIAPIDRIDRKEYRALQLDLFEDGDPDGCSPYGCRSGQPVEI
jgi:hypothetical protein